MATYWVSTLGDDGDDGSTYMLAKATIAAGLARLSSAGDVLNIVNDGTHVWPTSETSFSTGGGTDSASDPTFTIQGTDSSGNAAMATIAASGADNSRRLILMRSGAEYYLLQNLIFDATGKTSDSNAYTVVRGQDNANMLVLIRYCALLGGNSGTMASGSRSLWEFTNVGGVPNDSFDIQYCYYQNCKDPGGSVRQYGGSELHASIDHCVGIWDLAGRTTQWFRQGNWVGPDANIVVFTNNTFYEDAGAGTSVEIFDYNPNATDIGDVNVYSNLVWRNTTGGSNSVQSFLAGSLSGVTWDGTINANVLLGGPDVDGTELVAAGWYQTSWDSGSDTWPADTIAYEVADTAVFADPASTYDWELPNGLTITILKDLRPIQYGYSGLDGAIAGALPVGNMVDPDEGTGDDPSNPDDPAAVPFLDVYPFYATDWRIDLNARISTVRNRLRKHYMRRDVENQKIREWASRRTTVSPSTTKPIITGLEAAEFILVDATEQLQLNASDTSTIFLPAAKVTLVAGGSYETINLKNASASDSVDAQITVVD